MNEPYETLGVDRSATDKEIKDAFKKLARKFHPDLHPGDKEAEGKFKDISAANDLLKDQEKRRRFDAGEIDASGAERPQERFYRDFADGPAHASHATQDGFANNEELEEFLSRAFASGGRRSQGTFRARGQDMSYVLAVNFLDVANGAVRTITLPEGKTLQVTIPEGAEDRQMLRLKGQGMPGFGGGPPGDACVEPHRFFKRKDDNIHLKAPVTLKEAVLGARIEVGDRQAEDGKFREGAKPTFCDASHIGSLNHLAISVQRNGENRCSQNSFFWQPCFSQLRSHSSLRRSLILSVGRLSEILR